MNVRYINPFIKASRAVIGATLGEQADIGRPSIAPIEFEQDSEVILIGITGEVRGLIFLGFSKEVACKVAGRMIQFEINEIDDLARSALAELGNMIMGNTATIFSQEKIMVDITPPTVAKGNMKFDTKEVEHILVPIILGDSTIEMHIAIRK